MNQRRSYSREYKVSAVKMTEEKNITVREAAESLGIRESMLWKWKKDYKEGKLQAFTGNGVATGMGWTIIRHPLRWIPRGQPRELTMY